MIRRILSVLWLLLLPSVARAQTHPCDDMETWLTAITVTASVDTLEWCYPARDPLGQPYTSWVVYVNGAQSALTTVAGNGVQNAQGFALWSASGTFYVGTNAYEVAGVSPSGVGLSTDVLLVTMGAVVDITVPTVALGTLRRHGNSPNFSITASATDNVGVARVVFWLDGTQVDEDNASPYTAAFRVAARGAHRLEARAYDAAGNVSLAAILLFDR